jgi:hypothetical protein
MHAMRGKSMRLARPHAKPKVQQCRNVSPQADALARELQVQLGISANELAERAIYALAAAHKRQRGEESAA